MSDPCNKGPDIDKLQAEQMTQGVKLDHIIKAQADLGVDFKAAINRLTAIIEADIETRAAVEQLKKDRDVHLAELVGAKKRIATIEVRNAKCDGLGIFDKWDVVWNFIQQEKGWRRFVPTAMAVVTGIMAIYIGLHQIQEEGYIPHIHGTNSSDVGITE